MGSINKHQGFLLYTMVSLDSFCGLLWWNRASANEKTVGLLINTLKLVYVKILVTVYYYFGVKQWSLILFLCSLASHPARLDCNRSHTGFLVERKKKRSLSFPVFPRKNHLKITSCLDCIQFCINQNKLIQTSGHGPNRVESKRKERPSRCKGLPGAWDFTAAEILKWESVS